MRVEKNFFKQSSYELAIALLGKILVRKINNIILKCRIVETELYPGGDDKGSVSYNNRKTKSNEQVFMEAGTTYVYLTYGMYHCINISSNDYGGAVLLRAGEPVLGIEEMTMMRKAKLKSKKELKLDELCNGPAKLCISMSIDKKSCNSIDISENETLWIESDDTAIDNFKIVSSKRIGINRAGEEAVNKLYRFYIKGNSNVSKRDKIREEEML